MEVVITIDPRKKEALALLEYLEKLPFVKTAIRKNVSSKDIIKLSKEVNKSLNERLDKEYNNK